MLVGRNNRYVHRCDLPKHEHIDCFPPLPPFSPWYKKWIRQIRTWCTISSTNGQARCYFPSRAQIVREKRRHVMTKRYTFIIHPFSKVAVVRERFMLFVWFFMLVYEPYTLCIEVMEFTKHTFVQVATIMFDVKKITFVIMIGDIIVNFLHGYRHDDMMMVELEPALIAKRYLKTFFVFDFVATSLDFCHLCNIGDRRTRVTWKPLVLLRLVRIVTLTNNLKGLLKTCRVKHSVIWFILVFVMNLFLLHWLTSILFFLPNIVPDDEGSTNGMNTTILNDPGWTAQTLYIVTIIRVTCHFFGAFTDSHPAVTTIDMAFLTLVLIIGYIQVTRHLALGLQYFGTTNFSEAKYEQFYAQVSDYMRSKNFPIELRHRIQLYFEHKFQKRYFLEHVILDTLSPNLRYEILLYDCRNLLNKVNIMKKLPKAVVGAILPMLKQEIYLPNDNVLKCDSYSDNIYFVSYGTVGLFCVDTGLEMCHFEDGSNFGENHIYMTMGGIKSLFDVIALEVTEIYTIPLRQLRWLYRKYPEFQEMMEDAALRRMEYYNLTYALRKKERDTNTIISELRRGRILDNTNRN